MTVQERASAILTAIAHEFALGTSSISKDDILLGKVTIAEDIGTLLEQVPREGLGDDRLDSGIAALRVMADVWGSGFDLASAADFVDDDNTVADLVTQAVSVDNIGSPKP